MATPKGTKKDSKAAKSSKVQKKAKKAEVSARKKAAKTTLRDAKKVATAQEGAATKTKKFKGHAPQSSRITPPKGPVLPLSGRTSFAPKGNDLRQWLIVDAAGQTVGRLATQIASLLRGKHKASFTPNNDVGDFVVVINAEKVTFSSNKSDVKEYHQHSGYISGLKTTTPTELLKTFPDRVLRNAVRGMVPRNPLGREQMRKLMIYAGDKHPHAAQKPVAWKLRFSTNG